MSPSERVYCVEEENPYKMIALPAIHQTIHDGQNTQPDVKHLLPLGQHDEVV